jgi:signal transduction histidine kinase
MSATTTGLSVTTPSPTGDAPSDSASEVRVETANRVGTALLIAAVAATFFAAVAYLLLALEWRSAPFFGALVTRIMQADGSLPIDQGAWTALEAGIHRSDRIVAIDGESLNAAGAGYETAREAFNNAIRSRSVGDVIEVSFLRPAPDGSVRIFGREVCGAVEDGSALCRVRFPLSQFSNTDFLAFFVIPFVCGLITAGIGALVLILRPRSTTARTVSAIAFLLALFMFGLFDLNTTHTLNWLWIAAAVSAGTSLIQLGLIFPTPIPLVYRRPVLRFLPQIVAVPIALVLIVVYNNPPSVAAFAPTFWIATLITMLGGVTLFLMMVRRRTLATTAMARDQINAVMIGVGFTLVVGLVWLVNLIVLGITGVQYIALNTSATMPFFVTPALGMAYAVLQYRLVDTDRMLSQTITYTLMLVGLIIGYFLLVYSATLLLGRTLNASDPILVAVLIFLMAVLFVPVRQRIQTRIDQIYYRRRLDYQAKVETFAQRLSSLVEFDDIVRTYQRDVVETLLPSGVYIFLPNRSSGEYTAYCPPGNPTPPTDVRFSPDSPLVQWFRTHDGMIYLEPGKPWLPELLAERPRLLILNALVLLELRGASEANGFVVVGAPTGTHAGRSSRIYTYDELRFLQGMTSQISVAVERAQVIESLERRVRELDALSQVSQAANFTIAFDDLLELINTQAERLVEASHFYIALYDQDRDELSFAFFLENGERYEDKESQRWHLGRDLFSEIVRRRQPLRVSSYPQAMAERGVQIVHEDTALTAWMGVPLIAGTRALGVLAAGNAQNKNYTDEQLKIFQDIAALAATSLDKARLFQQTNARARQLAALNDISRRLVASESDIDRLLELITGSATDILDAAAGSLLLTAEDGSGDLEFKVAVGGSGSELIGVRIPAKRGLVGEVASTGRPIIVSDAATDSRWSGELSKGAFHTTSVLAAPLIAQNRVIGVLEVLNKKSGGGFTNEDTELLSTFAGQAAVAIENARLFRLTDEQLSARLGELETLERIDVELNRSLDVGKVAEITVRYAIDNSPARAGVIGLVTGDPPRLEIIHKQGYSDGDAPLGSEADVWMLDRGIVRRVMRTRQADLVPDVSIDPDYVPSLRGSISQITLPMLSGAQIIALLVLETDREPRLRLADMPFLQRLAEHASIAIANAKLYADLARANESKSEFVSFVAHELKNPLASVKGFAEFLLGMGAGAPPEAQRDFLDRIRNNAERMRNIVDDLNDATKLETNNLRINPMPCDFHEILTETIRPFEKRVADKQQTLATEVPETLPRLLGDQNRLIQVLTNFVSNAYKYTPEGGTITIRAEVVNNRMDSKGQRQPPALQVAVQDTGIGMSQEDLERLFTPYFRSTNEKALAQEGTGLGMTITRGLIERHGGDVWVKSELGVGTTFYFTIPLMPDQTPVQTAETTS